MHHYDFTVEFKRGSSHTVPDALSRMYQDEEQIQIAILEPSETIKDKWYIERHKSVPESPKDYKNYKIVNCLLYYYWPNPRLAALTDEQNDWKLAIPKNDRERVLIECHDQISPDI